MDDSERITPMKCSFDEAVRMVLDSRIVHGPSALLILKVKAYLETHS